MDSGLHKHLTVALKDLDAAMKEKNSLRRSLEAAKKFIESL